MTLVLSPPTRTGLGIDALDIGDEAVPEEAHDAGTAVQLLSV
jgi:hypothetical protein